MMIILIVIITIIIEARGPTVADLPAALSALASQGCQRLQLLHEDFEDGARS